MKAKEYCQFDIDLVRPRLRSVRVNGFATCFRLEEIYWKIIEKIARDECLTVGKLISRWALETDLTHGPVRNFTGFIRVVCVVHIIRKPCGIDLSGPANSHPSFDQRRTPLNSNIQDH
jgi:predicted DNA-binding ribbon-helix-helix protein